MPDLRRAADQRLPAGERERRGHGRDAAVAGPGHREPAPKRRAPAAAAGRAPTGAAAGRRAVLGRGEDLGRQGHQLAGRDRQPVRLPHAGEGHREARRAAQAGLRRGGDHGGQPRPQHRARRQPPRRLHAEDRPGHAAAAVRHQVHELAACRRRCRSRTSPASAASSPACRARDPRLRSWASTSPPSAWCSTRCSRARTSTCSPRRTSSPPTTKTRRSPSARTCRFSRASALALGARRPRRRHHRRAGGRSRPRVLGGLGGLGSLFAPIHPQNVELKLTVKPQINESDFVRMAINEQTEEIASHGPGARPHHRQAHREDHRRRQDQETVVIGGIMQDRTIECVDEGADAGRHPAARTPLPRSRRTRR